MLYEIRRMLPEIIDHIYVSDQKLEHYKRFYLVLEERSLKSKNGSYNLDKKTIRILGVGKRPVEDFAVTTLHELAHHIDNVQRGTSNHDSIFYDIYRELLFRALEVGFVLVKDVKQVALENKSADSKRLADFLVEYEENDISKEKDKVEDRKLYVYNSFAIKEELNKLGYQYNSIDGSWFKTVSAWEVNKERIFLLQHIAESDIDIVSASKIHFRHKNYIEVTGKTFACQEILKKNGFTVHKENKKWIWKKETTMAQHKAI